MKPIVILGEGAWGTALATVLAHNGHTVFLWCYNQSVADGIQQQRMNSRYLPQVQLSELIVPVTDFSCLQEVEFIFEAIPVQYLRSVLQQAKPFVHPAHTWVVLSKGMEQERLLVPSQMIHDVLGYTPASVVVSGPSFASDLAAQQYTAVLVASEQQELAEHVAQFLNNTYLKTYYSEDTVGVQLCGAMKNVIALAMGMFDGAGYADNTKAWLFTQGLSEIQTVVRAGKGQAQTVHSLAGIGDLVLTALIGTQSRNVQVGRRLGRGESLEDILRKTGYTPEGINTLKTIHTFAMQHNLKLPLCTAVYRVIFENASLEALIPNLFHSEGDCCA
jgi:glycerol-3-phosphate dehydrogenase (NAD(P)+)